MYNIRRNLMNYVMCNCKVGQKKYGVEFGPMMIMNELKKRKMPYLYDNVHEITANKFKNQEGYNEITRVAKQSLEDDVFSLFIGGDHSISAWNIPHYFDKYRENMHLVWIDAHGDINSNHSSESGNTHGMSVYDIFNTNYQTYKPSYDQLTYVGIRDLDMFEKELILENDISYYTQDMVRNPLFPKGLNIQNKFVYISFDIDSICSSFCTATGTPVEGGLFPYEVIDIIDMLNKHNTLVGFDLVEYNPLLYDKNGNTLFTSAGLITYVSHLIHERHTKSLVPF